MQITAQTARTLLTAQTAATAQILRMQIAETITKGFREGTAWRCLFYLQDSVLGAWHTLNGFSFFTYTVIEGGEWKEWIWLDFGMIAANELDRYVEDGEAFIIDLRMPEEYRRCHIKGAVNIPYGRLGQCRELPRGRTLVLYCERGAVSMVAAKELARGYRVKTVIGGIHAYREIFD